MFKKKSYLSDTSIVTCVEPVVCIAVLLYWFSLHLQAFNYLCGFMSVYVQYMFYFVSVVSEYNVHGVG